MGKSARGSRDGSGPFKGSAQSAVSNKGKRGGPYPDKKKRKNTLST